MVSSHLSLLTLSFWSSSFKEVVLRLSEIESQALVLRILIKLYNLCDSGHEKPRICDEAMRAMLESRINDKDPVSFYTAINNLNASESTGKFVLQPRMLAIWKEGNLITQCHELVWSQFNSSRLTIANSVMEWLKPFWFCQSSSSGSIDTFFHIDYKNISYILIGASRELSIEFATSQCKFVLGFQKKLELIKVFKFFKSQEVMVMPVS